MCLNLGNSFFTLLPFSKSTDRLWMAVNLLAEAHSQAGPLWWKDYVTENFSLVAEKSIRIQL